MGGLALNTESRYMYNYHKKILASDNTVITRLFMEHNFFTMLGTRLFATALPYSLCTHFRLKQKRISRHTRKNNVPEMTDLLQYLPMLDIFAGRALISFPSTRIMYIITFAEVYSIKITIILSTETEMTHAACTSLMCQHFKTK